TGRVNACPMANPPRQPRTQMVGTARSTPLPTLRPACSSERRPPLPGAAAALAHRFLRGHRLGERRERLADDLVVRRPPQRLHRPLIVPDLADAGVVPADQIIAGLRRACDGKGCDGDAGGGTEG